MSELRKIKPISLAGLKPSAIGDVLPELAWAAPTDLMVDATYQRHLSDRSVRLIRKLVESFAWNRMKPPIVVKAGPASLHIIDGQHTAIVAASLGIPKIPILIVAADSVDERARAFVGHNRDRVAVSPFDIYNALVAAGDPDALDVANVCQRAKVRIRLISPSSAIAEGDTAAVGMVRALVKRRGVMKARMVLQALSLAKRAPISAAEILAADAVMAASQPPSVEALSEVVRIDGYEGLLAAHGLAKQKKIPVYRALQERWERRLAAEAA